MCANILLEFVYLRLLKEMSLVKLNESNVMYKSLHVVKNKAVYIINMPTHKPNVKRPYSFNSTVKGKKGTSTVL